MLNVYSVDRIMILKWNGYDENNEPMAASSISVEGYVEWRTKLVRDAKGAEVSSQVSIRMDKAIERQLGRALCHEDRIQLEGESEGRSIINILRPKAFSSNSATGGYHYEVFLHGLYR